MKPFKVYANPQGGYEAIEQGWSWNACGFGPFWALSKKMWAVGFGVLGAFIAIWGIAAASIGMDHANLIINVGSVVQCVIFGSYGLTWQQTHLESRGFVFKDTVTAAHGKDAIERYLKDSSENQSGRQASGSIQKNMPALPRAADSREGRESETESGTC